MFVYCEHYISEDKRSIFHQFVKTSAEQRLSSDSERHKQKLHKFQKLISIFKAQYEYQISIMSNSHLVIDSTSIPEHWLYCPRACETIVSRLFLPFKTPLDDKYRPHIPLQCTFTPQMMITHCKAQESRLSLWIDLTNTERFYDGSVVEANGIKYLKLKCKGDEEIPSLEEAKRFIDIVHNFTVERPHDIIGVHCTDGFNRTGFLIASYLIEKCDCSVLLALFIFSQHRDPGVYKQDFIMELYKRYGKIGDYIKQTPELPDWCRAEVNNGQKRTFSDVTPAERTEEERRPAYKKPRPELNIKNATFMEGVPGVVCVQDPHRVRELQQKVQQMCGWVGIGFPGAQPVSMDGNNIAKLSRLPYCVSWKAEGTRYLMLINKRNEIYFFDRNNSCFQVENISFVKSSNLMEHLEDTLIDGEMVLDKYQGNVTPRYLINDIIIIRNFNIGKQPFFPDRWTCIQSELIHPRIAAIQRGIINRASEPFSIRSKDFWDLQQSAALLGETFAKQLLHRLDGLVFKPSHEPYSNGLIEWKKSHHPNGYKTTKGIREPVSEKFLLNYIDDLRIYKEFCGGRQPSNSPPRQPA